jgi:proliferating cell nuclear antigen
MKVKLENPQGLTKAIELISELVTEVRIKLNEFGMSIVAMDPANVSLVSFKLPKSAFLEFEEGEEVWGVNLDNLKKILKRCGAKSELMIEREENMLHIKIHDRIKRDFSLGLIEIESEDKDMPNLEFSSKVGLASTDFIDCVQDSGVVSDACSFKIENGNFIIEAKGTNSARAEFSPDEADIQAEDCHARYSLEYLDKFTKAAKLTEKITLNFAQEHPLKMEIKAEHMEMTFLLAPRVETED